MNSGDKSHGEWRLITLLDIQNFLSDFSFSEPWYWSIWHLINLMTIFDTMISSATPSWLSCAFGWRRVFAWSRVVIIGRVCLEMSGEISSISETFTAIFTLPWFFASMDLNKRKYSVRSDSIPKCFFYQLTVKCRLTVLFWLNCFPHIAHWNGFSPMLDKTQNVSMSL